MTRFLVLETKQLEVCIGNNDKPKLASRKHDMKEQSHKPNENRKKQKLPIDSSASRGCLAEDQDSVKCWQARL